MSLVIEDIFFSISLPNNRSAGVSEDDEADARDEAAINAKSRGRYDHSLDYHPLYRPNQPYCWMKKKEGDVFG